VDTNDLDHGDLRLWAGGLLPFAAPGNPSAEVIRVHQGAIAFGISLVVIGIVATILAGLSHLSTVRRLRRGELPVLTGWPLSVTVAVLVAVAGMAGLWSLLAR